MVTVRVEHGEDVTVGTGMILTSDGYIVTNTHVIDGADRVTVTTYDGRELSATVTGAASDLDLSVLKAKANGLTPAAFASSKECYVGQSVYAVGTPANTHYGWSVSHGIISFVNRPVSFDGGKTTQSMLQTDAAINHGNSGGPLLNSAGQVVGIVTTRLSGDYAGVSFAIPSDAAVPAINAILSNQDTTSATEMESGEAALGIQGQFVERGCTYTLSPDGCVEIESGEAETGSDAFTPLQSGVCVLSVDEGFDAENFLAMGDLIVYINGVPVTGMDTVCEEVGKCRPGDAISVTYLRGGISNIFDIVLGAKQ